MDDANKAMIEKLQGVIRQLEAIVADIGGSVIGVRPDRIAAVDAALNAKTCLQCNKSQEESRGHVRGLCHSCYQSTKYRLRKSQVTERELIFAGLLAPSDYTPMRTPENPTLLDDYIAARGKNNGADSVESGRLLIASLSADKSHRKKKTKTPKPNETK